MAFLILVGLSVLQEISSLQAWPFRLVFFRVCEQPSLLRLWSGLMRWNSGVVGRDIWWITKTLLLLYHSGDYEGFRAEGNPNLYLLYHSILHALSHLISTTNPWGSSAVINPHFLTEEFAYRARVPFLPSLTLRACTCEHICVRIRRDHSHENTYASEI